MLRVGHVPNDKMPVYHRMAEGKRKAQYDLPSPRLRELDSWAAKASPREQLRRERVLSELRNMLSSAGNLPGGRPVLDLTQVSTPPPLEKIFPRGFRVGICATAAMWRNHEGALASYGFLRPNTSDPKCPPSTPASLPSTPVTKEGSSSLPPRILRNGSLPSNPRAVISPVTWTEMGFLTECKQRQRTC